MKLSNINIKINPFKYVSMFAMALSLLFTACGEGVKHSDQETEIREDNANTSYDPENEADQSNAASGQTEMQIDTTASASYGGTENSVGRIDADTSSSAGKGNKGN